MVNFKSDESLGKVVKDTKCFCSLGVDPVNMYTLNVAGGGNKFSRLCGFIFESANSKNPYPRFSVAFVCKLRSKIYHQQQTNPSQWFIFKLIDKNRVDVLDKKSLEINYGFDIDKFFQSDLFKKCLPRFEQTIGKGMKDAEKFVETLKSKTDKMEATKLMRAITESLPLMKTPRVNDKYYELNNLDAIDPEAKKALSKDEKSADLDKKLKMMDVMNKKLMSKYQGNAPREAEVDEASKFECVVKQEKQDGEDVFSVYEKDGLWVATFHNEKQAEAFVKEYPTLKKKYLSSEADKSTDNKTEDDKVEENDEAKLDEALNVALDEEIKKIIG